MSGLITFALKRLVTFMQLVFTNLINSCRS